MSEKRCPRCTLTKPALAFNKNRARHDGLFSYCRSCQAVRHQERKHINLERKRAYGRAYMRRRWAEDREGMREHNLRMRFRLTLALYQELLQRQNGVCAICELPDRIGRNLAVDHDPACCPGKKSCGACIRGLLCYRCNTAIGQLDHDAERLKRAAYYLGGP